MKSLKKKIFFYALTPFLKSLRLVLITVLPSFFSPAVTFLGHPSLTFIISTAPQTVRASRSAASHKVKTVGRGENYPWGWGGGGGGGGMAVILRRVTAHASRRLPFEGGNAALV